MDKERSEKIKCDFKNGQCSQLAPEAIETDSDGKLKCGYYNLLNSGETSKGSCRLKDYNWEEYQRVLEFKRRIARGEIDFRS